LGRLCDQPYLKRNFQAPKSKSQINPNDPNSKFDTNDSFTPDSFDTDFMTGEFTSERLLEGKLKFHLYLRRWHHDGCTGIAGRRNIAVVLFWSLKIGN
jgi:hypothetical protein